MEILEVALVLPLLFMFLLGAVWFGRAFQTYASITQAAQQGAVTAARPACTSCVQDCPWADSNANNTSFPCDSTVESSVFAVMDAAKLNRSEIVPYIPSGLQYCALPSASSCGPGASGISICRSVVLNPGGPVPQCGMIVSFQYPFEMNLPFTSLNLRQIMLRTQAESRMEN
jgi:hypothetical protein